MAITTTMTNIGRTLLNGAVNGGFQVQYTVARLGDGVPSFPPTDLVEIINEKMNIGSVNVRKDSTDQYFINIEVNNQSLTTGFELKELGVYGRRSGTADTPILVFYVQFTDEDIAYFSPHTSGATLLKVFKINTHLSHAAEISLIVSTDFGLSQQWANDHLAPWTGGSNQHPLANDNTPGLMSPAAYRNISNLRSAEIYFYTTLYTNTLPPRSSPSMPYGVVDVFTPKSLWIQSQFTDNDTPAFRTMMISFWAKSTASGEKFLTVYESDDTTRVYVNGVASGVSIGAHKTGQISLGTWDNSSRHQISVVVDNRGNAVLSSVIGRLVNCEVE